nr:TIGR00341 family protein [Halomarina oriensis]
MDDEDVEYVVSDETGSHDYEAIVAFPLPTNAVENVLASLRDVGVDESAYTVVTEAETVVSHRFDALEAEYADAGNGDRIAREELRSKAEGLASTFSTYVVMTVVSAVIATAGLLLDSPATVVGSMVIAPLIGPAMATAVGTVIDDEELFVRGVKFQVLGVLLSVGAAAVFAWVTQFTGIVPPSLDPTSLGQVRERLAPDALSLAVALGAGVAGVVSLTTGVSTALVGVMIAVALIPPAATVGIAIAYGLPSAAISSSVLTLVNLLSINLAALLVLWYSGYRPERFFQRDHARSATLKRLAALGIAIALLSVFLGGVTYDSYTTATDEQAIRDAVSGVVNESSDVTLLETQIELENRNVLFTEPERIVVTIGAPPGDRPPGLASRVDRAVDEAAGRDVEVQIRYVEVETARLGRAPSPAAGDGPSPARRLAQPS